MASARSMAAISLRRKEPGAVRWRWRVKTTAAASSGSPSWKVTPGRSWMRRWGGVLPLIAGGEDGDDFEPGVHVEQLVAQGGHDDGAGVGAGESGVEHVRVGGEADAEGVGGGLGVEGGRGGRGQDGEGGGEACGVTGGVTGGMALGIAGHGGGAPVRCARGLARNMPLRGPRWTAGGGRRRAARAWRTAMSAGVRRGVAPGTARARSRTISAISSGTGRVARSWSNSGRSMRS